MEDHVEDEGSLRLQRVHRNFEGKDRFRVVSLELALDCAVLVKLGFRVQVLAIWLDHVAASRKACRRGSKTTDLEALEKRVAGAICINTCKSGFLSVINESDLETVRSAKFRYGNLKLFHYFLHDNIAALVNDHVSKGSALDLLQVAHDKLTTISLS